MKTLRKFLQTFVDFPGTGVHVHHGHNESNIVVIDFPQVTVLANTDTVTITLPAGVDKNLVPIHATAFSNAVPRVRQGNFAITSHNITTGVTVLTASGAVAANSTFTLLYAPSTVL